MQLTYFVIHKFAVLKNLNRRITMALLQATALDSDDDDGDDTKQLDCWELIDPTKTTSWTTLWSPYTTN